MIDTEFIEAVMKSKEVADLIYKGHTWGTKEELRKLLVQTWNAGFKTGLAWKEDKHDGR